MAALSHAPSNNSHPIPTRLLSDDERDTLDHLAASCCTTGVDGVYIWSKIGQFMSKGKIAYIYSQARNERLGISVGDTAKDEMSEYDHLTKYFESTNDIAYTVLWDVVPKDDSNVQTHPISTHAQSPPVNVSTTNCTPGNPSAAATTSTKPSSRLLSHTKLNKMNSYD